MSGEWREDTHAPHPARGTFVLVPDGEDAEDEGAEGGGEEAAPIVADGEEGGGDLDAEEDAWHREEGREGGGETQAGPRCPAHFPPRAHAHARPAGGPPGTTDTLWGGSRASLAKHVAGPRLAAAGTAEQESARARG